jgi:hypothetical protein
MKKNENKGNKQKQVAFHSNIVSKEDLPFPIVHYPGFYGAFFGFRENMHKNIVLCSCSKEAVENYIKLRLSKPIPQNSNASRMYILDSMYFPIDLVFNLMNSKVSKSEVISHIDFENEICHECKRVIPEYKYCHEMYGGVFKQNYGWYINKQAFEFGVEPISNQILPELCPQEILDKIAYEPNEVFQKYQDLLNTDAIKAEKFRKKIQKQNREIWTIIENEVRQKFGHKKIGEAWTSETILYYIVCTIYPNLTVFRHYRPKFLNGLELDIFIKELNIGIEYQGIQHYKPVKHWGGKIAFEKLKERDKMKREICNSLGVKLVYFDYDEGLNNEFVLNKLSHFIE